MSVSVGLVRGYAQGCEHEAVNMSLLEARQ